MPEKLSFGDMEGEDLATTVLTCEGDITDPAFPFKLQLLVTKLQHLISDEEKPIKVTKVEPWNSVRVTFNIPQEAAQRLRQLAERGDQVLRELGILSVQIEGDQVITLTLAGQFNEPQEIVLRKTSEDQNEVSFNLSSSDPIAGPSSSEPAHKNIGQFFGHIVGGAAAAATATVNSSRVDKPEPTLLPDASVPFRSPNVIAPNSTEPIPFPPCSTTLTVSSSSLTSTIRTPSKTQAGFRPFPFASMTHAMNTKQGSSSPQYQPGIQNTPRLAFTSTTTALTAVARTLSAASSTSLPTSGLQSVSNSAFTKVSRSTTTPVFNNVISRVTSSSSSSTLVKPNIAMSSPLLVNLLQSDSSNIQGSNKIVSNKLMPPPTLAANQAMKRKRKPRKPKEKSAEDGNASSPGFSASPSPPLHIGMRPPVTVESMSNLNQPFGMALTSIPTSTPNSHSNQHFVSKIQSAGTTISTQTATIHPQAQGQPPVSLHSAQTHSQHPLSTSRHLQGQQTLSSVHRQGLGHQTVPNIHPQAQGQPQVHTGNLPLHTHIPVGSPQLARLPGTLQTYAMSTSRGVSASTTRTVLGNRDSLIIKAAEKSYKDITSHRSSSHTVLFKSSSSTPNNSTPESNPFPSPPSSADGKTKHLINPFTGQLEPMPSDEEEEDESIGSLPPFPDFEIDTSENGQSERSLSDGGKENNISSDTDSGISKSHTDISQSSTECGPVDPGREMKKLEAVPKVETVSSASVASSIPGEKLKLRLKLDPKTIRESKEVEQKEKKAKDCNPQLNQKNDSASSVGIPGGKKGTTLTSAHEPRVPPLHISLRGPNAAVVVSPRKDDAKSRYFGKEDHLPMDSPSKISQKKVRSPRSGRTMESLGMASRTLDFTERKGKGAIMKECKKSKDDYWNQNVKNMSGGGIVEMSEKMPVSRSSSFETYLPNITVGNRKLSLGSQDSCKSDVITLTSCATGESVSIHTPANSRSPLPFHLMVSPEINDNLVAVAPQQAHVTDSNSTVQIIASVSERTPKSMSNSSRNHGQEGSSTARSDCRSESSIVSSLRKSQLIQKGYLPHSSSLQTDSRNCIQKVTSSGGLNVQSSSSSVPPVSNVPPNSPHNVSVAQTCTSVAASVITSVGNKPLGSDVNKQHIHVTKSFSLKSGTEETNCLASAKYQSSNQCNTRPADSRTDASKGIPSVVQRTTHSESAFSNSLSDSMYSKATINEVQINATVNKDQTANHLDTSKNNTNHMGAAKDIVENSVVSPVIVKQALLESKEEPSTTIFPSLTKRCKSPLANVISMSKGDESVEATEQGVCLIEVKKPPIAQIITVDTLPMQSCMLEVPSLPPSLVKSDIDMEASSIPSLIPSHGSAFLPTRTASAIQGSRQTSLGSTNDGNSSESNHSSSTPCLESYPVTHKSNTPHNRTELFHDDDVNNPVSKSQHLKTDDINEQSSSVVPSEESSMDSIDEERKRCLQASSTETRTSTPGPPSDTIVSSSICVPSDVPKESGKDLSEITSAAPVTEQISLRSSPTYEAACHAVVTSTGTGSLTETSSSSSADIKPLFESTSTPDSKNCGQPFHSRSNPPLSAGNASGTSENLSSETCANKSPIQVSSTNSGAPESVPPVSIDETTKLNLRKGSADTPPKSMQETKSVYSMSKDQSMRSTLTSEPVSVMCSPTNSVVSSLLSQSCLLSPDSGRVRLVFKGSTQHSMLSGCSPSTGVVLPLNSAKTVPIKFVTLPSGTTGLSVRSTSNPNVVEIIGPKSTPSHSTPTCGSLQRSSPVRLVVSAVSPGTSNIHQSGASNVRNRVVVKSVVVTGKSSPIKLASASKGNACSLSSVTSSSMSSITAPSLGGLSTTSSISTALSKNSRTDLKDQMVRRESNTTAYASSIVSIASRKANKANFKSRKIENLRIRTELKSENTSVGNVSTATNFIPNSLSVTSPSNTVRPTVCQTQSNSSQNSGLNNVTTVSNSAVTCKEENNLEDTVVNSNCGKVPSPSESLITDTKISAGDKIPECAITDHSYKTSSDGETSDVSNLYADKSKNSVPDGSSAELSCTNLSIVEDSCNVTKVVTMGTEIPVLSTIKELCSDTTQGDPQVIEKCNTHICEDVVLDEPFLLNSVQNEVCISPKLVIKSEDVAATAFEGVKDTDTKPIRPFKEPKMEMQENASDVREGKKSEESETLLRIADQGQLPVSLVYTKPLKRKCSENAAELIKACMGVEDSPKRGVLLKTKFGEEIAEKDGIEVEAEKTEVRMGLRLRRDDSLKKFKGQFSPDCSSDEELALSELVAKTRTRERPTRSKLGGIETPVEQVNCRPSRRRSGSNESQKSDEIKLRSSRREVKKDEPVRKLPERTNRRALKESATEVVPVKRRCYSKDGHR